MTREDLVARWRTLREEYGQVSALVDGAKLCNAFLADLEQLWCDEDSAEVTLQEASQISGYSGDHLRRLARDGLLKAHRRGRRLYVRRGDLPRKAAVVDVSPQAAYDPRADA